MGNAQARQRIKARDFEYLAKNTRFATMELVEEYFDNLMEKYTDGKMEEADFIKTFSIAFPTRPEEKVKLLAERMSNQDGKISMANMLILFYLFSDGKLEDNLVGIFNLFDADGNKIITLNELYEIMAVFIEIGEGKDHQIDLAKTMAEMFKVADKNKDDVMDLKEFQNGVMEHPVTAKIFRIKKIDALLDVMAV
eukprot:TRINITY_DN730_c0_g1_i3.p2 TRINITY_DN730_c0_g1~~TRINITY_DN730_c0_g1_i3.p2  ORF type:complete len:195 (-),score=84.54 TRINITY_DN730_c0_g1_i3:33-617(-)